MPLSETLSDVRLITQMKTGDEAAARDLYRRYSRQVYRFATLWTGNHSIAADVTQEVFSHFFQHPGAFDPTRGALSAWLLGVARNRARHHVRDAARWTALNDEDDALGANEPLRTDLHPLDTALTDERAAHLHALIRALPASFRDVVILIDLHELSYAEVATITDTPLNTVRTRLFRARAALAHAWIQRFDAPCSPDITTHSNP